MRVRRVVIAAAAALLVAGGASAEGWPPEVERALEGAGPNRGELERVLDHYARAGDAEKLAAAGFLIANMPGHGYVVNAFFDREGNEIEFDALEHPNYREAQAAFDALEREHGPIEYGRKAFVEDLRSTSAAFLIENIDLAFQAWRGKPWASAISFDAFCEHILPYRGTNEPVVPWRSACDERLAGLTGGLSDPHDLGEVGRRVQAEAGGWVRFSELYYLHPTDQGFDEMLASRTGRCEDMSNMMGYALRASAVPAAQDFTPFWADRDNNHAWTVLLDAEGRGRAPLAHRAAKVYRKTYSIRPESLGARRRADEIVPRRLEDRNFRDVTDQYMETTDVTVPLTIAPPEGARFAYLCVFNGGEWQAIHWGPIEGERATFTGMGRRIAYLPAYFTAEGLRPAAPPVIVAADGALTTLDGAPGASIGITLAPRGAAGGATVAVAPGVAHELLVWEAGWRSLGRRTVESGPAVFEDVPAGRLYWLLPEGTRRLERIFTIEGGAKTTW